MTHHHAHLVFSRLDDSLIATYLSEACGLLEEQGVVSNNHVAALRTFLSKAPQDPLQQKDVLESTVFRILLTRYGARGCGQHTFMRTLEACTAPLLSLLEKESEEALTRAERLFNRKPDLLTSSQLHPKTIPWSKLLTDLAAALTQQKTKLEVLLEESQVFTTNCLPDDPHLDLDKRFQERLGFLRHEEASCLDVAFTLNVTALCQTLEDSLKLVQNFYNLLTQNTSASHPSLVTLLETLKGESLSYAASSWDDWNALHLWSLRRKQIGVYIIRTTHVMSEVFGHLWRDVLPAALGQIQDNKLEKTQDGMQERRQPLAEERVREKSKAQASSHIQNLSYHLLTHGVSPRETSAICRQIELYLENHDISAPDLLKTEWHLFHPALKHYVQPVRNQRKEALFKLIQHLRQGAPKYISLLLAGVTLLSCGVKTTPVSDIPEIRPEIPFRIQPRPPSKKKGAHHDRPNLDTGLGR